MHRHLTPATQVQVNLFMSCQFRRLIGLQATAIRSKGRGYICARHGRGPEVFALKIASAEIILAGIHKK